MLCSKMARLRSALLLALLGVSALYAAQAAASGGKALVLLQDAGAKDSYSTFFDTLKAMGYEFEFRQYKESGLKLKDFDTWLYDHLFLFAPKAESFGGSIDTAGILEFVDAGHNLVIGANSEVSDTISTLASEVGVDLDEKGTKVFDHFSHAGSDHTMVLSTEVIRNEVITGPEVKDAILFRGVAQSIPADAELVTVVLSAPATAYSHDPRKSAVQDPPSLLAGKGLALVSVVQARNNARVLVSGSLDLFSNDFFTATPNGKATGNRNFAVMVAQWALQGRGVLKLDNARHHLVGSSEQPSLYRVNDEVEFLVDIHSYTSGKKTPYKGKDVQVDFTMLNPYLRLNLTHVGNGTHSVQFKVPDVYGVFKYVIDYKKQGYSYLSLSQQVPVRPYKHNEYERFLTCAYPYYASAVSTAAAFFIMGFFFLYHK